MFDRNLRLNNVIIENDARRSFFRRFYLSNCYINSNRLSYRCFFVRFLFNVLFYVDLSSSLLHYIAYQSHAAFSIRKKKKRRRTKKPTLKSLSLRCILLYNALPMFLSLSNLYLSVNQDEEKHSCYYSSRSVSSFFITHNVFSNINNSNFRNLNSSMT